MEITRIHYLRSLAFQLHIFKTMPNVFGFICITWVSEESHVLVHSEVELGWHVDGSGCGM